MDFSNKILLWYRQNQRELPWRNVSDPYRVWVSEVILQQTRIDQGLAYYLRFTERFPTIQSLAGASEDEVLKIWQGLGYYSRARNLLAGARQVMEQFNGRLPNNATELKKIKGIGDYTAAAIASIAFNEAVPAIDGNVYRVLARVFGVDIPVDSGKGKKIIFNLAETLMHHEHPSDFNQAMMEFGALHCKPAQPLCNTCIFMEQCLAHTQNKVDLLPVKTKKAKPLKRFFFYILLEEETSIYLRKRTGNDIWKNLYDFPLIEMYEETTAEMVIGSSPWKVMFKNLNLEITKISEKKQHLLTHQRLQVQFIHVAIKNGKFMHPDFLKIDKRNIFEWPVPKIIENYLNDVN